MSHHHHRPFCLNGKDTLKFHHFNNTSHFHLLLYSYYYWFKPLTAPLCVCFTCSFLTKISPLLYIFFLSLLLSALPTTVGGVGGFEINLSLSFFWDCSLANLIKQFAKTTSIFLLKCFLLLNAVLRFSFVKFPFWKTKSLSAVVYFMFRQWMWPKLCCWYLKLLQHLHSVNEFSLLAKMRHDVDVPAGSCLSVRKLPSGGFRNSGGLKFPLFAVQNKPPHDDKCRLCCKQYRYMAT